jgi:putative membrane protein
MDYYAHNFWGMNMIWWVLWMVLICWIFVVPYDIPGQRNRRESAIDILRKRLANGSITNEQYAEKKALLEEELTRVK